MSHVCYFFIFHVSMIKRSKLKVQVPKEIGTYYQKNMCINSMGLGMRKPVFMVPDKERFKPACLAIETS